MVSSLDLTIVPNEQAEQWEAQRRWKPLLESSE